MSQGGSVQFGLLISVLLHVVILGGALFSIQSRPETRLPETEPVAVGMISPGEVTKVRLGARTAKLLEAEPKESPKGREARKEATRPKTAASAPPPSPPPSAAPEEKATPPAPKVPDPSAAEAQKAAEAQRKAADAQRKLEAEQQKLAEERRLAAAKQADEQAKAEALKRAEERKQAEERKRAEEAQRVVEERKRVQEEQKRLEEQRRQAELKKKRDAERKKQAELRKKRAAEKRKREEEEKKRLEAAAAKSKFDTDKIAALIDRTPDAAPPPPSAADQASKAKGPTLGAPDGKDRQLTASERGIIQQAIRSCVQPRWNVLSGGASARETVVKIRIRFNADGTLSAPPEVQPPPGPPTSYFRAISESALRAVQECEPYNLPPDLYHHWKDILMSFSPTDMY